MEPVNTKFRCEHTEALYSVMRSLPLPLSLSFMQKCMKFQILFEWNNFDLLFETFAEHKLGRQWWKMDLDGINESHNGKDEIWQKDWLAKPRNDSYDYIQHNINSISMFIDSCQFIHVQWLGFLGFFFVQFPLPNFPEHEGKNRHGIMQAASIPIFFFKEIMGWAGGEVVKLWHGGKPLA